MWQTLVKNALKNFKGFKPAIVDVQYDVFICMVVLSGPPVVYHHMKCCAAVVFLILASTNNVGGALTLFVVKEILCARR